MQIIVSGKHLDIGDSLRSHIVDSVEHNVIKFFEGAIKAHVTVSKQHYLFKTDITVNEGTGTGVIIKSNAESDDAYISFDDAVKKLSKQLRRYKTKIKKHHKKKVELGNFTESTKYVIAADHDEEIGEAPAIIAEKPFKLEKMSVADAVMHMDLMDLPAYMFINNKTGVTNVVYYRKDGNISWVAKAL